MGDDYLDGVYDQVVSRYTEPCPPGSVLHSFPTTVKRAKALGLPYVVLTGDDAADRVAVAALKASLRPASEAAAATAPTSGGVRALPALACRARSLSKSVSYWAGSTGAGVTARAFYFQSSSCGWYLQRSEDYLFDPLSAGQDLYWDEVYYESGQWYSWDAGCQRLYYGNTYSSYYGSGWWINIGYWYTDETINDSSLGCDWWGEEYTGSVRLTG